MISVIPWDRMVEMLKGEARAAVARSGRRDRIEEQLGPIEGFVMTTSLSANAAWSAMATRLPWLK